MNRTYLVTYKTGRTQTINGHVVFFSSVNTDIPRPPVNAVYLNADDVMSVIEQPSVNQKEA